jgi:hypothetical protein
MTSQWPNNPDGDGSAVHGFGCLPGLGVWLALGALMVAAGLVRW